MDYRTLHPEDVKATIRKRFGSLLKFEEKKGLPRQSVTDLLRGKASARVAAAVNKALSDADATAAPKAKSGKPDDSRGRRGPHCLNAKAA
jgi:hypothetical protein